MASQKTLTGLLFTFLLMVAWLSNSNPVDAAQLEVSTTTNKSFYTYRQIVTITGNLTLDGQPASGLVGIQVSDPNGHPVAARTIDTGLYDYAEVEILEVLPCDETGSFKDVFPRDGRAHVNVTLRNNVPEPKPILVAVFACDNDSTVLTPEVMQIATTILPNCTLSFKPDIYIQPWASIGQASFHVNAYSDWPEKGGHPYVAGKTAKFNISQTTEREPTDRDSENGTADTYSASFRLAPYSPFGTYTIHVASFAQGLTCFASTNFTHPYQVLGDVNFDHMVNILDVVQTTLIYGATSGTSLWNPEMDLLPDGKIDISDVVTAAQKYGTRYDSLAMLHSDANQDLAATNEEGQTNLADRGAASLVADRSGFSQKVTTGVDVYTQYPDPFNGRGLNEPSDMFWPQKQVRLNALTVYNLWPQQHILVAFQVIDPHGETWGIFYNTTGTEGLTFVKFTLPWPCEDPEFNFGDWTVATSASIQGSAYTDLVHFKYDYHLRLWPDKLSTDKPSYGHDEMIHMKVEYGTQSMQLFPAMFTVTAVDELGVPFAFEWASTWVGNAQYGTYTNYTIALNLYVPKFAFAGVATIHVAALKSLSSGETLCPSCSITVGIEPF